MGVGDVPVTEPGPRETAGEGGRAIPCRPDLDAAFRSLTPSLQTYAFRMIGDYEEARDVVQEAFLKAHRACSEGATPASLRGWLYRVTHNLAVNRLKAIGSRKRASERIARHRPIERNPEAAAAEEAVLSLPDPYRAVLVLKYFQRLTFDEIAQVLDQPLGTVKSLVARGLKQARAKLGAHV